MRSDLSRPLALVLFPLLVYSVALAQTEPPPSAPPTPRAEPIRLPTIQIVGDEERPDRDRPVATGDEADALTPPSVADFLVIPLRAHILSAPDLAALDCHLSDDDIRRIVGKVNAVYRPAGIHWALDPIVREPAARQGEFTAAQEEKPTNPLASFRLLAPDASRSERGIDVYYIHRFSVNGVFLGHRTAFVQETAKLRPVPGGIDEPLPRVTAHELGHALSLPHRQNQTNLLASGTTGTTFNKAEVARVRRYAPSIPGTRTVAELRHDRDEAQSRHDAAEVARIDAILKAIDGA